MRSLYLAGWASWLLTNDRILLWLLANEKPLPGRMGILAAANDRILLWLLANEKPLPGWTGILAADQ